MARVREVVAALGHEDVETYLGSGNVVLTPRSGANRLADELAAAIGSAAGFEVAVVLRRHDELRAVVSGCPFTATDPTRVVVAFLGSPVDETELGLGDLAAYAPDELVLEGAHAYVNLPNGQGRSKLMSQLVRRSQPTLVTVRNWRTVTALADLTR